MRLVYGIGTNDIYKVGNKEGKQLRSYTVWKSMLGRCYSKTAQKRDPTYIGCSVSEDWLLFSNFKLWYDTFYRKDFEVDKDILQYNNKLYSTETCVFVPSYINTLFLNVSKRQGTCKQGVSFHTKSGKYHSRCSVPPIINGTSVSTREELGYFDDEDTAYAAYVKFKINIVYEVANLAYNKGDITHKIKECIMINIKRIHAQTTKVFG